MVAGVVGNGGWVETGGNTPSEDVGRGSGNMGECRERCAHKTVAFGDEQPGKGEEGSEGNHWVA